MKKSLALALTASLAGVLLLGAPGSMAYLTDSTAGQAAVIQSGALTMSVAGPTVVDNEVYGAVPAGMVVRPDSTGIIPDYQRQSYTYTVTNTGSARATAALSASLAISGLSEPRYSATRASLQVAVSIDGAPDVIVALPGAMPATAGTLAVPEQSLVFAPGVAHTVTVRFSIPATSATSAALGASAQAVATASLFTFTPTFTLTQVPVAS